jgi:hypothetical protein
MRCVQSYARAHTHAYPHTPMRIRTRTHTRSLFKQTEHRRGGVSLQTLSSEERLRRAPFLTDLGTHSVGRSFPLPPQCMLASLAAVSVAARPSSHAHPVASKRRVGRPHGPRVEDGRERPRRSRARRIRADETTSGPSAERYTELKSSLGREPLCHGLHVCVCKAATGTVRSQQRQEGGRSGASCS